MNRRRAVVMLAAAIALIAPATAFAHGGPVIPVATRYAATVTSHPASLRVRVVDGDRQLWLDAPPADTVVVLGLAGEPYLRFTAEGVAINRRSPTTYLNRSQPVEPPATASTRKPPVWRTVSHGHSYRWHEDRLHALALTVRRPRPGTIGPWTIPLVVNGHAASIRGTLSYRQPPSLLWIWPLPVALACLAAVLRLRSPRIEHALLTVITLIALAAIVVSHLAQNLHGRPGLAASQLGWLAFACGFALLMGALLRRPRWRSLAALASARYALAAGLAFLPVLRDGTTLTSLSGSADRLTAVTALTAAATTFAVVLTGTTKREKAAR
jgi:hypothetical protein